MFCGHILVFLLVFAVDTALSLNEDVFMDFGFDLLSTATRKVNGQTEISIMIRAPPDATVYWEVNGIPVVEFDRYSRVSTERHGSIVTSNLTSREDIYLAVLFSYSPRAYFVTMKVILLTFEKTSSIDFTSQNVSFTRPQHTETSVNVHFKYNTSADVRTDAILYFVPDRATKAEKTTLLGNKQGKFFENQVSVTGNQVTSTVSARNQTLIKSGSTLATYGLFCSYDSLRLYVDYEIEDKADFTDQNRPLSDGNIVITGFYTRPSSLVGTTRGNIVCGAIGNPPPALEILKLGENGEFVPTNYPEYLFRTNFRVVKTLVINYPSDQDAGNYTCFARSTDKETSKWQFTKFEPPPAFNENATRRITKEDGTIEIILEVSGYFEFSIQCFANGINGPELSDEVQETFSFTRKDDRRYQNSVITITLDPSRERPNEVTCKAFYSWTGESYYTIEV